MISDEIHAPLVLPGARHVPYARIEGTAEHVTTVTSASKAWNIPGLKCAQIVTGTRRRPAALAAAPHVANHGVSPLGLVATVAAYTAGGPWLDGSSHGLADRAGELATLLAERLPDGDLDAAGGAPTWPGSTSAAPASPTRPAAALAAGPRDALARTRLRPGLRALRPARLRHLGRAPRAHRRRSRHRAGRDRLARGARIG